MAARFGIRKRPISVTDIDTSHVQAILPHHSTLLKLNAGISTYITTVYILREQVRNLMEQHELRRLTADVEGIERFGKTFFIAKKCKRNGQLSPISQLRWKPKASSNVRSSEISTRMPKMLLRLEQSIGFRSVFKEWQPILSHSALLQAMGSLLSSVINKVIYRR